MYARLRGVPRGLREGLAERLLYRLGLTQYADRWSFSTPAWSSSGCKPSCESPDF